jgi:hypothetical protein
MIVMLNQSEIAALLSLIEFHDDWNEVSEHLGCDIVTLYDKLHAMSNDAIQG